MLCLQPSNPPRNVRNGTDESHVTSKNKIRNNANRFHVPRKRSQSSDVRKYDKKPLPTIKNPRDPTKKNINLLPTRPEKKKHRLADSLVRQDVWEDSGSDDSSSSQ